MNKIKFVINGLMNLQLFAEMNTQTTGASSLSPEMKVFYSDYLIDNAIPKLVHDQFGQKHPIPKNGGKTIEFRKYSPLPKLLTPLTEGVTPDGQTLTVTKLEATVAQYGGYITLSDVLLLTAIDNNLVQATKLLGNQAGATLDTITAALQEGEKVQLVGFGSFEVKARAARIGRNPKTKTAIEIPASRVPVFKAGKALKDAVAK